MTYGRIGKRSLIDFGKNWGWYLAWGIILVCLGIAALSAATLTTLVSVVFLGVLLAVSGVVILFDAFASWRGYWGGFFLNILLAILYLIAGICLIKNPLLGSMSITLLLAIFFIVIGIYRILFSLSFRLLGWGWVLLNGLISLLLGILIFEHWPASSLMIIGLFVGIDLIFFGFAYIMASVAARRLVKNIA